jgi:hypothetical protein
MRTLVKLNSAGLRLGAFVATGLLALAPASTALASSGGNANAGDVWVDNVGQPAGPGHEQDPHLACQDINLWGSGLADSGGTYEIDGWAPSGHQEKDYSALWTYNHATGGSQVISTINVTTLIKAAVASGDSPVNKQGFHFKLQFSQDPQKHKTFWVNCDAPSPPPPSGGSHGSTGSPPPVVTPTTTGSPAPTPVVKATHATRKHKLVHPKRHVRAKHVRRRIPDAAPAFTG